MIRIGDWFECVKNWRLIRTCVKNWRLIWTWMKIDLCPSTQKKWRRCPFFREGHHTPSWVRARRVGVLKSPRNLVLRGTRLLSEWQSHQQAADIGPWSPSSPQKPPFVLRRPFPDIRRMLLTLHLPSRRGFGFVNPRKRNLRNTH